MAIKNISQEFNLKNINETRNYFTEGIDQNDLVSKKHKKICTALNYIEHFLNSDYAAARYVSISAFAYLVGILISITSSAVILKTFAITAGVKKYKSIIKKKKKKSDKIVLLAKLNTIKIWIFRALIDSYISHDEFI